MAVKVDKKAQLNDSELTELVKASLKRKAIPQRKWSLENVQTRYVAEKLNELTKSGHEIFAVNQSTGIGGTYEVIYYIQQ